MNSKNWPDIVVLGTKTCGDCRRAQSFLDSRDIPYSYHDVDEEGLAELVIRLNERAGFGSRRRVPTLTVGETILSVPSDAELAEALGIG